jgi:hypothetical protein
MINPKYLFGIIITIIAYMVFKPHTPANAMSWTYLTIGYWVGLVLGSLNDTKK